MTGELSGIILWAIDGWKSLRENGRFVEPASSKGLKTSLQESASPIQSFIAECCVISSIAKADKDELFLAWENWCRSHEHAAGKKNSFSKLLFEAQPQIKDIRPTIDGERVRLYGGIALRDDIAVPRSVKAVEVPTEIAHCAGDGNI